MFELNKDKSFIIDNVYVKYHIKDMGKIVIVFAHLGGMVTKRGVSSEYDQGVTLSSLSNKENNPSPAGFEFIKKENINVIAFQGIYKSSWYRSEEFYDFMIMLSPELDIFSERLGYGFSMGGFGVSSFANILNIDRVLLLAPFSTLNKKLVPFEKRYEKEAQELNWVDKAFDGSEMNASGYVIYDFLIKSDKKHANRYKNLTEIRTFGLGHHVINPLFQLKLIKPLFRDFVNNTLDIALLHKGLRKRRTTSDYYKNLLNGKYARLTPKRKEIILINKEINNIKDDKRRTKKVEEQKISADDINKIRDIAISLEKTNLKQAYILMKIARRLRPQGKVILQKVKEYSKKLNIE